MLRRSAGLRRRRKLLTATAAVVGCGGGRTTLTRINWLGTTGVAEAASRDTGGRLGGTGSCPTRRMMLLRSRRRAHDVIAPINSIAEVGRRRRVIGRRSVATGSARKKAGDVMTARLLGPASRMMITNSRHGGLTVTAMGRPVWRRPPLLLIWSAGGRMSERAAGPTLTRWRRLRTGTPCNHGSRSL